MSKLVIIVVVFVALALVFDSFRRRDSKDAGNTPQMPQEPDTANEALPTQTGKFRVQQMLDQTERAREAEQAASTQQGETAQEEEEEALPDPFKN